MRRIFIVAVMIAFLPVSAYAQAPPGPPTARSEGEKKRDAEIDKAYRDSLKRNTAGTTTKSDPWGTVRPATSDNAKQR